MIVKRVEKHIINRNHKHFSMLMDKCHESKNIYNHANYLIRQEFINQGNWLRYEDIEKLLHDDLEYPDYWNWNLANSSQQVLKVLDKNWKSFFKSIKDWKENPEKYTGRPKLPKYLPKNGYKEFYLTTNQAKLKKDGLIHFPKSMNGFYIKPKFIEYAYETFQQVRIIPKNDRIIVELIYTESIADNILKTNDNYMSIDLGVDNFATIVSNTGIATIINGKGLKSANRYYNKLIAKHKSIHDKSGNTGYSHKLYSITNKRNDKVDYFMNIASNYVIDLAIKHNISKIIIGKNDGWKQKVNLGKITNQKFTTIPFNMFIQKLTYKCEHLGIEIITTKESYTSGTSFLDNEPPTKEFYNKSRRIHRGLFKTNTGKLINADINGACQIMRKVFVNAFNKLDNIGFVMHPVRVNLTF